MKIVRRLPAIGLMLLVAWCVGTAGAQTTIVFPDHNLEAAIRVALSKPSGPLTSEDLSNLHSLSAPRQSITNLSGLEWATNLATLDVTGNSISNLVPLESLHRLVELRLDRNQVADPAPLAFLSDLETLSLAWNQVTNAESLQGLTNMSSLRLEGNSINSFEFLTNLVLLRSLNLGGNAISDLSPIATLTNLEALHLAGIPITDLSPLSGLTNLKDLTLRQLDIVSLDFLHDLLQISSLDLEQNRIQDISPLARMGGISRLNLRWNRIVTGYDAVLSGFTNMVVLYLGGNAISKTDFLAGMNRLSFLNLGDNAITNLVSVSHLTNLNYLVLSGNPITNLAILSGLTNLANLELRANAITDLGFMSGLSQLSYADLAYNDISNVEPLMSLPNLQSLVLDGNPIATLDVSNMSRLENLWLSGNSISNLSFLQNVTQLKTLGLDDNRIVDLSPLATMTNLTNLGLRRNPITNFTSLTGISNLANLWLDGNAISDYGFLTAISALEVLGIRNAGVSDLAVVNGLTNLVNLYAEYNRLTNINVLEDLPRLSRVRVVGNPLEVRIGAAAETIQNLQHRTVEIDFLPTNVPPSIMIATNWYVAMNRNSSLRFQIWDDWTPGDQVVVSVASSNPELIAIENISISGTNSNRTLTVMPTVDRIGASTITLTMHDGAGTSTSFPVQVAVMVPQPVTIPDPNLESAVRAALNRFGGGLTSVDLLALTELFISAHDIDSLSGLEWATNLTSLHLNGNAIGNLDVVQHLSHLTSFTLYDGDSADLSPLAGSTNLTQLNLIGCSVSNLSFVENLAQLTSLNLENNRISDLSQMAGLTNLNSLSLQQNLVTDLAPLQTLPELVLVDVTYNLLDLTPNSPAMTAIQDLGNYGASVNYRPQRGPPVISVRPSWVIMSDMTSSLSFGVKEPNARYLTEQVVTAKSSNTNLLPNESMLAGKSANADWFLRVTPLSNQVGTTTITLTATNDVGMGTSATILVTVVVPLPLDNQLVGGGNLSWVTGGNSPWFGQSEVSHDGLSAAQSGSIQNSQETWMQTSFQGPGSLTFWWKVSSEHNWDWLEFFVNDQLQPGRISGEVDWEQQTHLLPRGLQTVCWRYFKELADSFGLDTAWVDQISFTPLSWLEVVGNPTNGQCQLLLHPVVGKSFQLQASTNLVQWFPLTVVVATNSAMPFLDVTADSSQRFYRLQDLSTGAIWMRNPKRVGNEFQLELHSPTGLRFEVQSSTNLINWSSLGAVTNTLGQTAFTDPVADGAPWRFYRAMLLVP